LVVGEHRVWGYLGKIAVALAHRRCGCR
jgi:hypothetical protein